MLVQAIFESVRLSIRTVSKTNQITECIMKILIANAVSEAARTFTMFVNRIGVVKVG